MVRSFLSSVSAQRQRISSACLAALMAGMGTQPVLAEETAPPLERHPDRIFNFETANQLQKGGVKLWVGSHQTMPGTSRTGTANQFYWGGGEWGVTDRFQLGASAILFQDPPPERIDGRYDEIRFQSFSLQGKFGLVDTGRWKVAAQASAEYFVFRSDMYGIPEDSNESHMIGSLHLPITYSPNSAWQFHITPGVSFFPDELNGNDFFGTVGSVGLGATWKPSQRWLTYATAVVPFSGGNTITSDKEISRETVYTLGGRFNVSPKIALDLFLTNGAGVTPATGVMSMFPDASTEMIGGMITYTPGRGPGYAPNYRGLIGEPLTNRQRRLQRDGFTLTSADTLSPGMFAFSGHVGTQDSHGASIQFSPDYDGQIELHYEQDADDGSTGRPSIPSHEPNYAIGAKLRFMDQNNGSPFSLALRFLAGRDTTANQNGTFFLEMPVSYQANDRLAVNINPKAATWRDTERYALGLGVNYAVTSDLEAIAEVMPVSGGEPVVWAAGLRYYLAGDRVSMDLHATNAIGDQALKSMIGQDETKFSFGVTFALDASRR